MRIKIKTMGYKNDGRSRIVKVLNIPSFRITVQEQIYVGYMNYIDGVTIDLYKWVYKY